MEKQISSDSFCNNLFNNITTLVYFSGYFCVVDIRTNLIEESNLYVKQKYFRFLQTFVLMHVSIQWYF